MPFPFSRRLSENKLAMVVFSYYPADPRVRREAEALARAGFDIDVVCLKDEAQPLKEEVRGITVYRVPLRRRRGSKFRYVWEYLAFITATFFLVAWLHIRERYRAVHVHNMPDILVASALLPRITGSKVILDLHDPMPEVFMAKYPSMGKTHPVIRLLTALERFSIRCADVVLTPNLSFQRLFVSRGCPPDKIHIVMNSPDGSIFNRGSLARAGPGPADNGAFVVMYHGTIVERNGLDTALYAISHLRDRIPNLRFDVYGDGDWVRDFLALVEELQLGDIVRYYGFVPLERIVSAIEGISVGLVPNKRTHFTEINLPTRIFEYLCMGKPVVVPETRGILDYFDRDSMVLFEPGNSMSLSHALYGLYSDREFHSEILAKGMAVYRNYTWEAQSRYLVQVVRSVTGSPQAAG